MRLKIKTDFQERAKIFKALAHPVRLFIVDELSRREQCVQDLARLVDLDMSTVSKHLSVLKNVGLLEDDKQGLQVFYRLKHACVTQYFKCAEHVMSKTRP